MLRVNKIGLMQDYPWRASTTIERLTIRAFMANDLRMLLLMLVACFFVMLTGISHAKVEAVPQRAAPVAVGDTAPDFTLEDQNRRKFNLSESRNKNIFSLAFEGHSPR
jgi:cytochrome oxidase Cu insertion factor (SCO1/SenC/PrrC family)